MSQMKKISLIVYMSVTQAVDTNQILNNIGLHGQITLDYYEHIEYSVMTCNEQNNH